MPLAVAASIPLASQHHMLGSAPAPGPGLQPDGAPAARTYDLNGGIPSSAGLAPGSADAAAALLAGGQALPRHTPLTARHDGDRPLTIVAEYTEALGAGPSAYATGPGLSGGAIAAIVVVLTVVMGLGAAVLAWRGGLCTPGLDCARCCGRYA